MKERIIRYYENDGNVYRIKERYHVPPRNEDYTDTLIVETQHNGEWVTSRKMGEVVEAEDV